MKDYMYEGEAPPAEGGDEEPTPEPAPEGGEGGEEEKTE